MKKVSVIVKEKTILELKEDASKGDLIDLNEVTLVDTSFINSLIDSSKEEVFNKRLIEERKRVEENKDIEISKLKDLILKNEENAKITLKLKESELSNQYNETISSLKGEIEALKRDSKKDLEALNLKKQDEINIAKSNVEKEYLNQINELKKELEILNKTNETTLLKMKSDLNLSHEKSLNELKERYENIINQKELELRLKDETIKSNQEGFNLNLLNKEREYELKMQKSLTLEKDKFQQTLREKEDLIYNLTRSKASLNVKQTGEDLESWCDNEVTSYMQNGLFNCTWEKDNKVVKEEGEVKGSKADYIFKVYANSSHLENELLASICMDMKDENPDSVNKKTNGDYYKQLDKNRVKKNCKYALLVSNLEMDKPNLLPIFKVREYENMYVVRPAYLMVFLNLITSLTTRFSDLMLSKKEEDILIKSKNDLIKEFEEIKNTYLDKPLISLDKNISEIVKNSEDIKKASRKIDDICESISKNYLNQIRSKIDKFELKINKMKDF